MGEQDTREHMDNGVSVQMCPNDSLQKTENAMSEQDTREQLEKDVANILRNAASHTSANTSIGDMLRYTVPGSGAAPWQTAEDACEALASIAERKIDELTAERDELQAAIDAMGNGQFYAMYREVCAERDRLRGELATCQDVNERQDIEHVELKRERDRLQRVVRIQADSFQALERELADLRRYAQSDGQQHHNGIKRGSDGLKTGDLRDAAYRHERLLIALWRWLDIKRLRGEPVTAADVDMWRERLERDYGIKVE